MSGLRLQKCNGTFGPGDPVLKEFREAFLEPRREWFHEGLVIASASPKTVEPALANLTDKFPSVGWDLLGKREYPPFPFRSVFLIRRALGGLRLLWKYRKQYDLVVLMGAKTDRLLRPQCWAALLWMRPRRFFVFIEYGDGFWLSIDDAAQIRKYYPRLARLWDGVRPGSRNFLTLTGDWVALWLERAMHSIERAATRTFGVVRGVAHKIARAIWLTAGATLVVAGILLLGFFRLFYDTHYYRYRVFSTKPDPKTSEGGKAQPPEPGRDRRKEGFEGKPASAQPVFFRVQPNSLVRNRQGIATLTWNVTSPMVELRADSPSGEKVFAGGSSGVWKTGTRERSTAFYLQDASRGDARAPEKTLARLELEVRDSRPATFTADPNPIHVADGSGTAVATLEWTAPDADMVEIRVNSPDGPLVAKGGQAETVVTEQWVTDGTVFFLQDVSEGNPLTSLHTLGVVTVTVIDPVYAEMMRQEKEARIANSYPALGTPSYGEKRLAVVFTPRSVRAGESYQVRIPSLAGQVIDVGYELTTEGSPDTVAGVVTSWCELDSHGEATIPAPAGHAPGVVRITNVRSRTSNSRWHRSEGEIRVVGSGEAGAPIL